MAKNPRLIDLTGQRFGRWTVTHQAGNTPRGMALWAARCDCGNTGTPTGANLRRGISLSCGCAGSRATAGDRSRTHGQKGTRLYQAWQNMRRRCLSPASLRFKDYGGRGITICSEWGDFSAFRDWARGAGYADHLTLERIDVNGNYTPDNCTWADAKTQARNRRMVARTEDGTPWPEIAERHGVSSRTYNDRVQMGWDRQRAATAPCGQRNQNRPRGPSGRFERL